MCFLWGFLWFFHVLSIYIYIIYIFHNVFLCPFRLWEPPLGEHSWPDSVQATAGNSRLWTGGPVDVWPILAMPRCHDVLLRTARTHAIWICTRMVPTMLLGWNIREMHFRASAEDIQIFDMFHDISRFDMCAVCFFLEGQLALRWRTALRRDRCGFRYFSNTLRISKPLFFEHLWTNCGLGIDGLQLGYNDYVIGCCNWHILTLKDEHNIFTTLSIGLNFLFDSQWRFHHFRCSVAYHRQR